MVGKSKCIDIFNAMIRGTPISFNENLLLLYSEYLTENNIENSDKLIYLIVQNPHLIKQAIPKIVDYYCRKYNILSLLVKDNFNTFKKILYYE